jgi:hypothetical protein
MCATWLDFVCTILHLLKSARVLHFFDGVEGGLGQPVDVLVATKQLHLVVGRPRRGTDALVLVANDRVWRL